MTLLQLVTHEPLQSGTKLNSRMHVLPAEVEEGSALPPSSSSHSVNKFPFHSLFSAMLLAFFVLFVDA